MKILKPWMIRTGNLALISVLTKILVLMDIMFVEEEYEEEWGDDLD